VLNRARHRLAAGHLTQRRLHRGQGPGLGGLVHRDQRYGANLTESHATIAILPARPPGTQGEGPMAVHAGEGAVVPDWFSAGAAGFIENA